MAPTESEKHPSAIPAAYYDFGSYVSRTRMLTFWYQLHEVLEADPASVLEVGGGPGVVAGTLKERGVDLTTVDINRRLEPDFVASVTDLDSILAADSVDVILCARVLHHVGFEQFDQALRQLARVARSRVVLTLPVDEARLYAAFRRTAGNYRTASLALPLNVKRLIQRTGFASSDSYNRLWKINSSPATSEAAVRNVIERHFRVDKWYRIPEDRSHAVIVLGRR